MRLPLAALFVALAPAAATAGDLERLQGTWKTMAGPNKDVPIVMVVKDRAVTAAITTAQGQEIMLKGEVKLDEKAEPKQLDWIKFARPDGTGDFEDNLAIYKLSDDGDTLTVCSGGPGNPRPTEFKGGDDGRPHLLAYQRVKDAPKKEDAPKEAAKTDLDKVQGVWEAMVGPDKDIRLSVTIRDDHVTVKVLLADGRDFDLKYKVRLDEKATPKTWDAVEVTGADGQKIDDTRSIYELNGDELKVCNRGPGQDRPTEFQDDPDRRQRVVVFKRKKEEK